MNLSLKSNLSVFIGIPNLSNNDAYSGYIGSVLNHIRRQETTVKLLDPYITPPHAGKFHRGNRDRLEAIVGRMNVIVDKFMASTATHLYVNDGDVEPPPNCIDTLLRHDVDVASGVYPFRDWESRHAMCFGKMSDHPCGNMRPRHWDYVKGRVWGKKEPWTGGTGCMLIKRRVFERHHPKFSPLRFNRDNDCGMDMLFWKRAQDMGFTARVDARIICGHLPEFPLKKIDKWLPS